MTPTHLRHSGIAPGRGYAWFVVGLLSLLYVVSFVDRMILALLAGPITDYLGVSDTAIGLLIGLGFALLYVTIGLPIAHFMDRGNRKWIVVAGVTLWSAATLLSAWSESFGMLLTCRAGVAIGEAVLTPAAVSLIADMFEPRRRALPTSLFMATGVLMGTGAFVLGGLAVALAGHLSQSFHHEVWRLTLMIVSVPGFLLALIFALTVKEPPRMGVDSASGAAGVGEALTYLGRHWRSSVPLFTAVGVMTMVAMGVVSWVPTLLVRGHGHSVSDAGYTFGAMGVPCGVIGAIVAPWLANVLTLRGRADGVMLVTLGCVLLAAPSAVIAPRLEDTGLMLAALAPAMLGLSGLTAISPVAIQMISPARLRARMTAFYVLIMSLIGLGLGPLFVARASELWFEGDRALGGGLSLVAIGASPVAAALLLYGRRAFAEAVTAGAERP